MTPFAKGIAKALADLIIVLLYLMKVLIVFGVIINAVVDGGDFMNVILNLLHIIPLLFIWNVIERIVTREIRENDE